MIRLGALFYRQMTKELNTCRRKPMAWLNGTLFFAMMLVFFPLSLPFQPQLLATVAPGLVWMALLLSFFLSSERLFQPDYDEGIIEQWLVSGYPLSILLLAKLLVHWVLQLLPMLLLCPILGLMYGLNDAWVLAIVLSMGSPGLFALCALSASFGASLKQNSLMMALVLMPLALPIMILGSAAVSAHQTGLPITAYLACLLAISCLSLTFLPLAIAGVVRSTLVD